MGVVDGAQSRLVMEVAGQFADRAACAELLVLALASLEAFGRHPLGRTDGGDGIGWERQVERAVLAAEEAAGGEGFQFFLFAVAFELLADVDERRNGGIVRSTYPGDP